MNVWHPYPADQAAEDVEALATAAAELAVARGYEGRDAAAYSFAVCSLLVNSLFQGTFPENPQPTTRLRAV